VTPAVENVVVNVSVSLDGETQPLAAPTGWAANRMTSHDYIEVDGIKAYIPSPDAVAGKTIVIHADVVTPDGRHGDASLRVHVTSS